MARFNTASRGGDSPRGFRACPRGGLLFSTITYVPIARTGLEFESIRTERRERARALSLTATPVRADVSARRDTAPSGHVGVGRASGRNPEDGITERKPEETRRRRRRRRAPNEIAKVSQVDYRK